MFDFHKRVLNKLEEVKIVGLLQLITLL